MKKKSLIILIGMIMILTACSEEKDFKGGEGDMKEEVNVSESISKISVTGYDPTIFNENEEQPQERTVVFEKEEEIEIFLKAIKGSSVPSGDITSEGENFRIVLSYQDGNSDTILLWLYPDNLVRIQEENEQVRILSEEDIQDITKLLEEKFRNTLTD